MPTTTPSASTNPASARRPQGGPAPASSGQVCTCGGNCQPARDSYTAAPAAPAASRTSAPTPPPAAASSSTSRDFVGQCLQAALASRPGETSGRYLGDPIKMKLWTDEKVAQLGRGIDAARQFYPEIDAGDLAHLIVAEGAQETTGDWNLNVGRGEYDGQGFLQVTPHSVVRDFQSFGQAIKTPDGAVVVAPEGPIDLANVGHNVALWAWYTRNSVAARQSLAERLLYRNPPSNIVRDFGNAQLTWLAGPHNDRHNPQGADSYKDYHNRIRDYFVQSNFGDQNKLNRLLDTPVSDQLLLTCVRPGISKETWKP